MSPKSSNQGWVEDSDAGDDDGDGDSDDEDGEDGEDETHFLLFFEPPVSLKPLANGLWSILSWVIFSFW